MENSDGAVSAELLAELKELVGFYGFDSVKAALAALKPKGKKGRPPKWDNLDYTTIYLEIEIEREMTGQSVEQICRRLIKDEDSKLAGGFLSKAGAPIISSSNPEAATVLHDKYRQSLRFFRGLPPEEKDRYRRMVENSARRRAGAAAAASLASFAKGLCKKPK